MSEKHTVGVVARLVGVSVRTLHHYDEIGLVTPSDRTPGGYRSYSDADVERLHRVLTYRELGFPLEEIAALLDDPDVDALAHLRRQHALLSERIDRLHEMAAAVEKMMEAKSMGIQLTPEEQNEIFGDNWPGEEYAAEAEERWGDTDAWKQSQQRTAKMSKDDWKRIKAEGDAVEAALAQAMTDGVEPGSDRANALAEQHRAGIERFYDCDHAMQVNLAEMYLADDRFRRHYDDVAPGLAQYVRDVIVANAEKQ
ncbi:MULTISPECIES: MerR family transcriptional regulator [Rhodococcus]|uniref:MerR family transcriptional regulator n=1 Tax=Rhodococcus pseudokoreensis TaxID=2811421 RepID=A0A974W5F7_9NOCA|nr:MULTISPECIES: MerR family transcriptional regulator [Rhodococcus]MBV6757805.1 MerR family transcriptional regulator [Rhodococcus opacus]QSE91603.1 MerR family transcriptional regulator [Rhodococcus pseudokoreensis]